MEYFVLLLIILSNSFIPVFSKLYNIKTDKRSSYVFGGCMVTGALLFFLLTSGKMEFTTEFLGYSLGFGAAFGTAVIGNNLALRHGPIALTSLVVSLSLMIPTLYGIFFLNEKVTGWLILGLILLIVSLCLINSQKDDKKLSFKWVIFAALAFLGNGMCSTVQKMEQVAFAGAYKSEFMIAALLMVGVVICLFSFLTERKEISYCVKKGGIYALCCGLINGFSNYLVMVLGNRMPASVMFPLISALGIIGSFLVGRMLFQERLTPLQTAGMGAGILAIIFFNL